MTDNHQNKNPCNRVVATTESFNNYKNGSQDFSQANIKSPLGIAKSFNNNENGFQSLVNAKIYSPPGIAESFINLGSGSQILKNLLVECDDTSILSKIKASLPHLKILYLFNYNQDGSQTLPRGWKDYINSLGAGWQPPRP